MRRHRRPGLLHDEEAPLIGPDGLTVAGHDLGHDARQGTRGRAWHRGHGAGQGSDHDRAGLGLPPGINDRAATAADHPLIPHPCLGIDRLANRSQQSQTGLVVLLGELVTPLHERPDRRRCRVEDGDLVIFDDFPEPPFVGPVGGTLIHHAGRPIAERAIDQIRVTGHPAHVGRVQEIGVVGFQVEDPLARERGSDKVTAGGVQDALWVCRSSPDV